MSAQRARQRVAMTESDRLLFGPNARGNGLLSPLMWLGGLIATAVAMAVGAILAVVTAIAVAVIALIGAIVVFFAGLALTARRRMTRRGRRANDVLEAHKVGDAWVTYGWEQTGPGK